MGEYMYSIELQKQSMTGVVEKYMHLQLKSQYMTLVDLFRQQIQARLLAWQCQHKVNVADHQLDQYEKSLNMQQKNAWFEQLNIEQQVEQAIQSFKKKRFLVLVDDQQIQYLDQNFAITEHSLIQFIRLIPLVGG
jgi:hypothetical protein